MKENWKRGNTLIVFFHNFVAILRLRTLNMANDQNNIQTKRYPKFANFGEYLFWSYANLQMLCAALNMGKAKYDKSCYMIRAKAFKAYDNGLMDKHRDEMEQMDLPFNYKYIPLDYPQPELYM